MFGVLVDWGNDDSRTFEIFQTQKEATEYAENTACMGFRVTVFDYDKESNQYIEFYSL